LTRVLSPSDTNGAQPWINHTEGTFRFALNEDAMATDKLAEGIRLFVKDLRALRTLVQEKLQQTRATPARVEDQAVA
jgi:transaldolase